MIVSLNYSTGITMDIIHSPITYKKQSDRPTLEISAEKTKNLTNRIAFLHNYECT